jgi:pimeloyl-ACP methyl ester carboxylesterase
MPTLTRPDATIAYDTRGDGPPVLLIQGAGAIGTLWQPQIDGLCDRHTLAWFDNRGIG